MEVEVIVRLKVEARTPEDAFAIVDAVLDDGTFQDAVNDNETGVRVKSVVSEAAP